MSFFGVLLAACLVLGSQGAVQQIRIHRIEVAGNLRVPTEGIVRQLSALPGATYDEPSIRADVRKLYATGLFQDLEVSSREAGAGQVDLIYRVREYPVLSSFEIEGVDQSFTDQIRALLNGEKLTPQPSTPFRPEMANKITLAVRALMYAHKHPMSDVHVNTEGRGNSVRAVLKVNPGPSLEVGDVRFSGNSSSSEHELVRQMRTVRPPSFISRWSGVGKYSSQELTADLERVRQYYQSHGFAAVSFGNPETVACSLHSHRILPLPGLPTEKTKLEVRIPVVEGPQFELQTVSLEGEAGSKQDEIEGVVGEIRTPQPYDSSLLERTRDRITQILGRSGYAMAQVDLDQTLDYDKRLVHAIFKVQAGYPVLVGRITFTGNQRLPDKYLRRELRLSEGDLYDSARLDESIGRLNRTGLIEEMRRKDVALKVDEERKMLDVVIQLKEKKPQGIWATGGTGGAAGGYLGIIYSAFNLLGLGEKFSFELDGGASQSNLLLNLVGSHFLGTPFIVGLAAVHRVTDLNIASLVPNQNDLVGVFRRKETSLGLSGSYPVSTKVQVGLGFLIGRETITNEAIASSAGSATTVMPRTDLTPSFAFDSTGGAGGQSRGYRVALAHTWSGTTFLRTLDSTRELAVFRTFRADPLTQGRNLFALQLQGITALPLGTNGLALERRLFPGDEMVRGFGRGALSPWSYVPGSSSYGLQPAGADTALGISAEYRVPLYGPLSTTAFVDLGWTRLNSLSASEVSGGTVILDQTNRLLRMSLGGELRLELPVVHQPARFIFAWNPLRLDTLIDGAKPQKLADPLKAFKFALGNVF